MRADFPELLDLDEDAQRAQVQSGFVNFYSQDNANPYVALTARGPQRRNAAMPQCRNALERVQSLCRMCKAQARWERKELPKRYQPWAIPGRPAPAQPLLESAPTKTNPRRGACTEFFVRCCTCPEVVGSGAGSPKNFPSGARCIPTLPSGASHVGVASCWSGL